MQVVFLKRPVVAGAPKSEKTVNASVPFEERIAIVTVSALLSVMLLYVAATGSFVSSSLYSSAYVPPSAGGSPIGPSPAGPLSCGATITTNTIMTNDLLNCPQNGIIIGANNIRLDCADHLIDGDADGENAGVILNAKSGVTIQNCRITQFDAGIYMVGGSKRNRIQKNTIYGTGQAGIVLMKSTYNQIANNIVDNNEGDGIYLEKQSDYNTLSDNTANNNVHGDGFELKESSHNTLTNNLANLNGNGFWIQVGATYNTLMGNLANENGWCGVTLGSASYNTLLGNVANENEKCGLWIFTTSHYNIIRGNEFARNERGLSLTGIGNLAPKQNKIWNNRFIDNEWQNAEQTPVLGLGNEWDDGTIGNYWSDWPNNPGYPTTYIIPGEGDGVDHHPIS